MSDEKPGVGKPEATRKELADLADARAARIAELEALLAAQGARPPSAPVASDAWVLLTSLRWDGKHHPAGDVMPFDPEKPPAGCGGLEEGVHYQKARVLRG